jgi:hypothetical protein
VDYARGTLRRQVTAEIRASVASPRPPVTPSKQVTSCVRLVTGGVNPVFVERARFEGQPATIIVVPGKSGDVAWVTGAACSATDKDVLARTTLPPGI